MDVLKISAWVFDESIEGTASRGEDAVYINERLYLNESIVMNKSAGGHVANNFHIFIEFDGIIEVVSEDKSIHLSIDQKSLQPWYAGTYPERIFGSNIEFSHEGYVNFLPLNRNEMSELADKWYVINTYFTDIGMEYYMRVNGYRFDNQETPRISAQLKITILPPEEGNDYSTSFTIELVSYKYNEMELVFKS